MYRDQRINARKNDSSGHTAPPKAAPSRYLYTPKIRPNVGDKTMVTSETTGPERRAVFKLK